VFAGDPRRRFQERIEEITFQISKINQLSEMVRMPAFQQLERVIGLKLHTLTTEIDKILLEDEKKIKRKAWELSVKRWVAKYLGEILIELRKPLGTDREGLESEKAELLGALERMK
jgi:hypothetical protein